METKPLRLLLVDDHESLRRVLRRVFEARGVEIVGEGADGEQAVALAQQLRPDAVLIDVRMPVMDGIEATRQIKELLPETVVVVLSAYSDESLQQEATEAGAAAWFLKGSRATEVIDKVFELLRSQSALQGESHPNG